MLEDPINMFLDHVLAIKEAMLSLVYIHQKVGFCMNFRTVLSRITARAGTPATHAGTPAARAGVMAARAENEEFCHFGYCLKSTCGAPLPHVRESLPHMRGSQPHVRPMLNFTSYSVLRVCPSNIVEICI